jgi:hypothetical protein
MGALTFACAPSHPFGPEADRPLGAPGARAARRAGGLGLTPLASDRRTEQDSMTRKPSRPPEGS